jgi:hypothetical protein
MSEHKTGSLIPLQQKISRLEHQLKHSQQITQATEITGFTIICGIKTQGIKNVSILKFDGADDLQHVPMHLLQEFMQKTVDNLQTFLDAMQSIDQAGKSLEVFTSAIKKHFNNK